MRDPNRSPKLSQGGLVACILVMLLGIAAGMLVTGNFLKEEKTEIKTWKKDDFSITMNKGFTERKAEGYFAYYESKNALVVVQREEQMIFIGSEMTLEEYGQQVLDTNDRSDETMNPGDGFVWIEYTETVRDREIYYLVACYKSPGAFWVVNFAAPGEQKDVYRNIFMQWAESVKVG